MNGVAPTNPTAPSTGRNPIIKGAADAATNTTTTLTKGVKGAFLALTDTASLVGRIAFQVPATMLTVAAPSAAQQNAYMQKAFDINTQANASRQMAGLFDGLGSMLAGFIGGNKQGGGQQQLAKASSSGCGPNGCGAQQAWETQPGCGPNGCPPRQVTSNEQVQTETPMV